MRNKLINLANEYILLNNPTLLIDVLKIHPTYIYQLLKEEINEKILTSLIDGIYKRSIFQEGFSCELIQYLLEKGVLFLDDCKENFDSLLNEIGDDSKDEAFRYKEKLDSCIYISIMYKSTFDYLSEINIMDIRELRNYLYESNDKNPERNLLQTQLWIYNQNRKYL